MPPQDLLPDICQNPGFDVPRHRTPFCSWLGFAPQQTAKPACLAPHPDDPPMCPHLIFQATVQFTKDQALPLCSCFSYTCQAYLCTATYFPSALALPRSYQATRKGLTVCHKLHTLSLISKQGPQSFLVHARPHISCPQYNELAVGQRIKGADTKSTFKRAPAAC